MIETIKNTISDSHALETINKALEKRGAFYNDFVVVEKEFDKQSAGQRVNYAVLVNIIRVAYHKDGKIEGISSIDSSCSGCGFCQKMRKKATSNNKIICGMCYDFAQENSYRAVTVLPRHWLNMFILSNFDIPTDYFEGLVINSLFVRFNASGDVVNNTHMFNLLKICATHPDTKFTLWSKNLIAVNSVLDMYGKPSNLRFIQSSILIDTAAKRSKYADYVFTVYTSAAVEEAISSGAEECNGKKCKECGYKCYSGAWPQGANIAEKLRIK